jgi:hypothetical protein
MTDAGRTAVTGRRLLPAVAFALGSAITVGSVSYLELGDRRGNSVAEGAFPFF